MSRLQEIVAKLRERFKELSVAELAAELGAEHPPFLLDVREAHEWADGALPQASHLSRGFLEVQIESLVPAKDRRIVCYCKSGVRSLLAAETLDRLGYRDVASLAGGFQAWQAADQAVSTPATLSEADRRRYARHLSIPEVGEEGQVKLLQSRVLLIGAGGLGSPAAYYLAAAGVGTLGLVDDDVVDESNLQRQILHQTKRVGDRKTASAKDTLLGLNPTLDITTFEERLDSSNVDRIFEGWDLVIDGTDNFPTRYLVNDACVKARIPNIHGSVFRFEGQSTVFWAGEGPCYRCLYPEPPPPELAPSCAEAGVLGVLPGVIGLIQAIEALKILLGVGDPLVGRLLLFDALAGRFTELKLKRNPNCSHCADGVEFPGFVDYEQFCKGP